MYKAGQADANAGSVDTGVSETGAASSEGSQGIENGARPTETVNGVQATETAEESSQGVENGVRPTETANGAQPTGTAGTSPGTEQQGTAKTEQPGTATTPKPASGVNPELEAKLAKFKLSSEERTAAEEYAQTGKDSAISNEYGRDSVKRIMDAAEIIKEYNGKNEIDSQQSEGYNGNENEGDTQYYKYTQLKTEPNTAYFWSGRSSGIGGKEFSMSHAIQNGGTTLEGLMEAQGINMPIWDINDPVSVKAWDDASAAFANQASGEVRAIIGSELRPNNVWQSIELIRLMKNSKVTKIITIDPYTLIENVIDRR